ncbi:MULTISPECIES: ATP-binding protein [unclassified Moraxella]|uniref:ATP-binding protein n=1 Tax=unclassified Moraxella TaxID=2685852 RepID=UPI003AF915E4
MAFPSLSKKNVSPTDTKTTTLATQKTSTKANDKTNNMGGRYRSLIISIALFLSLIGALLAYTFYASNILQQNTALINTSNRVANDAQLVIKDIFDMQNSYGEDITSPHMTTVLKRLKENSQSIDEVIKGLETDGKIVDKDGHTIYTGAVSDPSILPHLKETKDQWLQLKPKVEDYLKVANNIEADSSTALSVAGEQAKTSSLAMNDSLAKLTDSVYEKAENQANSIRMVQLIGVAAILGYFAIFIFFFLRRLRDADAQAIAAQQETADIMANVGTGLFLLDKELNIGNQYSAQLAKILGDNKIAGQNLTRVLKNRVSDKDLETTEGFVKQLYNPRVKEKLVDDLNPLKKVMLHDEEQGISNNRYLDFKFSRVYQDSQIDKILVNVQDVTHQVRLEQRLEHERAQNDLQIEMLTTILNVSPAIIQDFITNTKQNITKINDVLKTSGSSQGELEDKLTRMYRIMHSLKGEASALNLHSFTSIASNFEEKLKGLQGKGKLSGNDFLPLTIHLDELLNLSNTIEALGRRINQNTAGLAGVAPLAPASTGATIQPINLITPQQTGLNEFYEQFAQNIATRQQKQVSLKATGFNEIPLPHQLETTLKEIVIQLVRNAVVHGIETPEQRISQGKPAEGRVGLSLIELGESYKLTIEDDGRGLDFGAIQKKAIEMGFDANDVANWSKQKLTGLLFKSGFSTQTHADEDSGRGVGMDIVKEHIQSLQGHLGVDTKEGLFTRFTLKIPKDPNAE